MSAAPTTAERVDEMRAVLPQELAEHGPLAVEAAGLAVLSVARLHRRVLDHIAAIYAFAAGEGWTDEETFDLIDTLPIRSVERAFDLLAEVIRQDAVLSDLEELVGS